MEEVNVLSSVFAKSTETRNYALQIMRFNLLWKEGLTGDGIVVGVVDTGIDMNHDMLKNKVICGKNFSTDGNPSDDIYDYHYHGTAVSSVICGNYMNYKAYGVAPNAKIIVAKSMDASGKGSLETIANGINYCVEQGCDIINCSVGSAGNSIELEGAVRNAVAKNISVVVASGNDGHNDLGDIRELSYPAGYDDSICVGAIDSSYTVAGFSNSNEFVDIVAPGVDLLMAYPGNRYAIISGTSFACPLIAGTLALLKQKFRIDFKRDPNESELFAMLIKYTREIRGVDRQMQGHGYFDASIRRIKR